MRNNTTATVALLGILAFSAVGCASSNAMIADDGPCDWPVEAFQSPEALRMGIDEMGNLAPDPQEVSIDVSGFRAAGSRLTEYFRGLGQPYDSARIGRGFAERINAICGPSGTLVILIHGINNTYDEARRSYKLARMQLRELSGRSDLKFLEVYWDGRTGDPLALWGRARETSKWAGLGLRPLLRALDPGIAVRVVTHSRGAAVICSALWNLPLREGDEAEARFQERQLREPAPDARRWQVAMLVPGMPGEDFESCPAGAVGRMIVGVNPDDGVVGKGILPASSFGSTALGCEPEEFRFVERALNGDERRAFLVDLSNSPLHDFLQYLLRRPFEERMVPLLFEDETYQARSIPAVTIAP